MVLWNDKGFLNIFNSFEANFFLSFICAAITPEESGVEKGVDW